MVTLTFDPYPSWPATRVRTWQLKPNYFYFIRIVSCKFVCSPVLIDTLVRFLIRLFLSLVNQSLFQRLLQMIRERFCRSFKCSSQRRPQFMFSWPLIRSLTCYRMQKCPERMSTISKEINSFKWLWNKFFYYLIRKSFQNNKEWRLFYSTLGCRVLTIRGFDLCKLDYLWRRNVDTKWCKITIKWISTFTQPVKWSEGLLLLHIWASCY